MSIWTLYQSISWRYKLLILIILPTIVAVGSLVFAGITITNQNLRLAEELNISEDRQARATDALVSILQLQNNLKTLIATEDTTELRTYAISTIKASSELDETIQLLEDTLSGNPQVAQLKQALENIRPMQLKVIRLARANNDEEALAVVAQMNETVNSILTLARTILKQEQNSLRFLSTSNTDEGERVVGALGLWTLAGLGIALLLGVGMISILLRNLKEIRADITSFAMGNLDIPSHQHGTDELGQTSQAIFDAIKNTTEVIDKLRKQSQVLQQNAFEVEGNAHKTSEQANHLRDHLNSIDGNLRLKVYRTESVEKMVQSITQSVQTTANECEDAGQRIGESMEHFSYFREHMNDLSTRINQLSQSASAITEIANAIRGVSDQTNLLALNAAIEAARADEHGRGFAVVADEVRTLANKSGDAAREISGLADEISSNVGGVISALSIASEMVETNIESFKITRDKTLAASLASQQSKNEIESMQNNNILQKQGVSEIHKLIVQLNQLVDETTASVVNMDSLSQQLTESSTALSGIVEHFKTSD